MRRLATLALALALGTASQAQTVSAPLPTQTTIQSILNVPQTISPPTSGTFFTLDSDVAFTPSASTVTAFAYMGRVTIAGASGLTNPGHVGGTIGWVINNNTGTLPLIVAEEGRIENNNGGTLTSVIGHHSLLAATNGPITSYFGYSVDLNNITAAITNMYGFYFPAVVGTGGNTVTPGVMYAYLNVEPAAFTYTFGPVIGLKTATFSQDISTALHYDNTSGVPVISACGTSPPVATAGSSNSAGQFTMGTGTPTACTVTFANAYTNNAFCVVTPITNITALYRISAQSKSAFTVTLTIGTSSVVFNYVCGGN